MSEWMKVLQNSWLGFYMHTHWADHMEINWHSWQKKICDMTHLAQGRSVSFIVLAIMG